MNISTAQRARIHTSTHYPITLDSSADTAAGMNHERTSTKKVDLAEALSWRAPFTFAGGKGRGRGHGREREGEGEGLGRGVGGVGGGNRKGREGRGWDREWTGCKTEESPAGWEEKMFWRVMLACFCALPCHLSADRASSGAAHYIASRAVWPARRGSFDTEKLVDELPFWWCSLSEGESFLLFFICWADINL